MKWYIYFILSGMWIIVSVINSYENRNSIWFNIACAVFFAILGLVQYLYDVKGLISKKVFKIISILSIVIAVLALVFVLLI